MTEDGDAPRAMEMGGSADPERGAGGGDASLSSSSARSPVEVPAGSGSDDNNNDDDDGCSDDDEGIVDEYGALMTVSEAAEMAAGGWTAPAWARFVMESPFRMEDPVGARRRVAAAAAATPGQEGSAPKKYVNEATGWAMDSAARGPMNQIGSFVGSAVIQMAVASAGCENANNCSVAGGIKPSSLLTLMSAVVGVVAAVLMPIAGAVIDHTRHRKLVASASAFCVVLFTGMQIAMSPSKLNWLYVLILDGLQAFSLLVHTNALFAYLPELTLAQSSLPVYTSHFNIRQFLAQLSLSIIVIVAGSVWAGHEWRTPLQNSVATAQLAVCVAFTYGVLFFGYSWTFLFRKRPALSTVPPGSNLVTTGFKQVANTSKKIWSDYRALRWFMFSLLWSPEAGAGVVQSIAVTFLVVTIKFTTVDIAIVSLIVMVRYVATECREYFAIARRSTYVQPLLLCSLLLSSPQHYHRLLRFAVGVHVRDAPDVVPRQLVHAGREHRHFGSVLRRTVEESCNLRHVVDVGILHGVDVPVPKSSVCDPVSQGPRNGNHGVLLLRKQDPWLAPAPHLHRHERERRQHAMGLWHGECLLHVRRPVYSSHGKLPGSNRVGCAREPGQVPLRPQGSESARELQFWVRGDREPKR
jgi:Vacuole effluxer Atg22 like